MAGAEGWLAGRSRDGECVCAARDLSPELARLRGDGGSSDGGRVRNVYTRSFAGTARICNNMSVLLVILSLF